MHYLDTSVLVALLCREPKSEHLVGWLAERQTGGVAISHWSLVELASALSLKIRTGSITNLEADRADGMLKDLVGSTLQVLPVEGADFHKAATYCAVRQLNLRGPDALHLAIAERLAISLATFDRQQFSAAQHFNIAAIIP